MIKAPANEMKTDALAPVTSETNLPVFGTNAADASTVTGAPYVATERLYLDADGQVVHEDSPDRVELLVGVGGKLPRARAMEYGLIEESTVVPAVDVSALDTEKADLARQFSDLAQQQAALVSGQAELKSGQDTLAFNQAALRSAQDKLKTDQDALAKDRAAFEQYKADQAKADKSAADAQAKADKAAPVVIPVSPVVGGEL